MADLKNPETLDVSVQVADFRRGVEATIRDLRKHAGLMEREFIAAAAMLDQSPRNLGDLYESAVIAEVKDELVRDTSNGQPVQLVGGQTELRFSNGSMVRQWFEIREPRRDIKPGWYRFLFLAFPLEK